VGNLHELKAGSEIIRGILGLDQALPALAQLVFNFRTLKKLS
jgi:hypothetical protein